MEYKKINANTEEGFQDLEFNIEEYFQDENQNHIVRATGIFEDEIVGFEAVFKPDMPPGIKNNNIDNTAFCKEGISLRSMGIVSDRFVQALSKLYNQKGKRNNMVKELKFTSFAIGGNPKNFAFEDLKFKLFYDDLFEKGLYSELYLNVNIQKKIIELKEKDVDYRENIYRALTRDYPNVFEKIIKKVFKRGQ